MAGNVTYLSGRHGSRNGGWIAHTSLTHKAIDDLERAIGRKLTSRERLSISDALSAFRDMRNKDSKTVSQQSIKRTLQSMAKLSPHEARNAFDNCDVWTKAEIVRGLYFLGLRSVRNLRDPSPDVIPKAAQKALDVIQQSGGGRPMKGYQKSLLEYSQRAWEAYRGERASAWAWGDSSSPFLRWAHAMFSFVEGRDFDPGRICKLMKRTRGKVSTL